MRESDMDRRVIAERKMLCQSIACRACRYFYQGDLPSARSFFTVLQELRQEIKDLEANVAARRVKFDKLMAPRKPWFERP